MKARLIQDRNDKLLLLCANGSISEGTQAVLANFLANFKNADIFNGDFGNWKNEHLDMALYPGETVAMVTDEYDLVIKSFVPFVGLLDFAYRIHKYISPAEYAAKYNKSVEIIKVYCREGRIFGAVKKGTLWMIPEDAPYPVPPERRRDPDGHPRAGRPRKSVK